MVGVKLNRILLLTPLVILAGLSAYLLSEEGWCDANNECENSFFWIGYFLFFFILFYGVPASVYCVYLIYRKLSQKKKEKVSSAIS